MALRGKKSIEIVTDKKAEGGVSPAMFLDFCIVDGDSLSLSLL